MDNEIDENCIDKNEPIDFIYNDSKIYLDQANKKKKILLEYLDGKLQKFKFNFNTCKFQMNKNYIPLEELFKKDTKYLKILQKMHETFVEKPEMISQSTQVDFNLESQGKYSIGIQTDDLQGVQDQSAQREQNLQQIQ